MEHTPEPTSAFLPACPRRDFPQIVLGSILAALTLHSPLSVADTSPVQTALDGKAFQSQLGVQGQSGDIDDLLVFDNGEFVSEECERRCGYAKVEYWVRAEGDAIQMRADVPCTESGAVMYWRGTVRGDEIEGSILWVNKRWYWTFEKKLWFKGRLVEASAP